MGGLWNKALLLCVKIMPKGRIRNALAFVRRKIVGPRVDLVKALQKVKDANKPVRKQLKAKVRRLRRGGGGGGGSQPVPTSVARNIPIARGISRVAKTVNGMIVSGHEEIGPISIGSASVGSNPKLNMVLPCNPALWAKTRISKMARLHYLYRPLKISVMYTSACSSTAIGSFLFFTNWGNVSITAIDFAAQGATPGARKFTPFAVGNVNMPVSLATLPQKNFYVDNRSNPGGLCESVPFMMCVSTEIAPTAAYVAGSISVDYTFEFFDGQASESVNACIPTLDGSLLGIPCTLQTVAQNTQLQVVCNLASLNFSGAQLTHVIVPSIDATAYGLLPSCAYPVQWVPGTTGSNTTYNLLDARTYAPLLAQVAVTATLDLQPFFCFAGASSQW